LKRSKIDARPQEAGWNTNPTKAKVHPVQRGGKINRFKIIVKREFLGHDWPALGSTDGGE
jgi:hypothetical protein